MNQRTEINDLLSADARGRKHIPFAVFAVIFIHVILFVVLLVAAGCRSSARAKANRPSPQPAQQTHPAEKYLQAATNTVPVQPHASTVEPVVATEPVVGDDHPEPASAISPESRPSAAATALQSPVARPIQRRQKEPRFITQQISSKQPVIRQQPTYVVQSGDTVEKIARRHGTSIDAIKLANKLKGNVIYPGQKLVVKPVSAGSTAQVKKPGSPKENLI
jgi:LysM repeat protein